MTSTAASMVYASKGQNGRKIEVKEGTYQANKASGFVLRTMPMVPGRWPCSRAYELPSVLK